MAGSGHPDLQRLLANLRGGGPLSNSTQISQTGRDHANSFSQQQNSGVNFNSIPGLGLLPTDNHHNQSSAQLKPSIPQPAPRLLHSEISKDRPATPSIPDASTITTWPAALKHVTKHVASNERAVGKIKHLISEQHKHERQWWAGREAIVTRHSGRVGNQAKVADLLKSLGGASVPVAAHDPKADQAELEAYDKKVYQRFTDMTADFDRQLRSLQIPFFAIKHDLVILGDGVQKDGGAKGRIDKGELRELQRRMVETLEDLFGED